MNVNKVSYSKLIDTIEGGIRDGINLTVVCDYDLAQSIVEFIDIEYPEFTDNCQLDESVDEYYITFDTFDDELTITCEFAKGKRGFFKVCDIRPCGYLIFLENWREVLHAIDSEVIAICELIQDEDEDAYEENEGHYYDDSETDEDADADDDCDCEECMIDSYTEILSKMQCPHCIRDIVCDIVEITKIRTRREI